MKLRNLFAFSFFILGLSNPAFAGNSSSRAAIELPEQDVDLTVDNHDPDLEAAIQEAIQQGQALQGSPREEQKEEKKSDIRIEIRPQQSQAPAMAAAAARPNQQASMEMLLRAPLRAPSHRVPTVSPDELTEMILSKLDGASLANAACVSKSWHQRVKQMVSQPKHSNYYSDAVLARRHQLARALGVRSVSKNDKALERRLIPLRDERYVLNLKVIKQMMDLAHKVMTATDRELAQDPDLNTLRKLWDLRVLEMNAESAALANRSYAVNRGAVALGLMLGVLGTYFTYQSYSDYLHASQFAEKYKNLLNSSMANFAKCLSYPELTPEYCAESWLPFTASIATSFDQFRSDAKSDFNWLIAKSVITGAAFSPIYMPIKKRVLQAKDRYHRNRLNAAAGNPDQVYERGFRFLLENSPEYIRTVGPLASSLNLTTPRDRMEFLFAYETLTADPVIERVFMLLGIDEAIQIYRANEDKRQAEEVAP